MTSKDSDKSTEAISTHQELCKHKGYVEWQSAVFTRDNYACRSCLTSADNLQAHHIVPWDMNLKLKLKISNGVALCSECYRLWHLYDRKGLFTRKEAALQTKILDGLREHGFYAYNVPGSPMGSNGTPDIILCYKGLFGGVEVKVFPNYLSELQKKAGMRIKAAGGIFYVAQSEDDIGVIIEMFESRIAASKTK